MKALSTYTYRKSQMEKKRQKLLKVAIILLVWSVVIGMTFLNNSVAVGETRLPKTVVVETGDTLWTLAQSYLPPRTDIRDYLTVVKKHNQLSGPIVYPGQLLELP
ncbi:MAG: LysM peptidoglycan-binding domain-containing protein [Firmicutes bacterium]|nr:LysM peptidoglycan-binding domain-containing protein [Bacillota bacterium]